MLCAARSRPTSLLPCVGDKRDKPMKDGIVWGPRGLVTICGANFGRVEQRMGFNERFLLGTGP